MGLFDEFQGLLSDLQEIKSELIATREEVVSSLRETAASTHALTHEVVTKPREQPVTPLSVRPYGGSATAPDARPSVSPPRNIR